MRTKNFVTMTIDLPPAIHKELRKQSEKALRSIRSHASFLIEEGLKSGKTVEDA